MITAAVLMLALSQKDPFPNTDAKAESPRSMFTEIRVGGYYPWVDRPLNCTPGSCPYQKTFNNGSMLLVEAEVERQLFQAFGSAAIGLSVGYAEKYGHALVGTEVTGEATSLRVVPMKALAIYRFDWLAIRFGIPLVPYVKGGFEAVYWWTSKGNGTELADGVAGQGISYGLVGMAGLAFLLDPLDPRLARDFDSGMGVNHTYLFAEYNFAEVNSFGRKQADGVTAAGLDLSSRFAMFGIAFEY